MALAAQAGDYSEQLRYQKLGSQDTARFPERLRGVLRDRRITPKELGYRTGVHPNAIYRWRNGSVVPNLTTLFIIRRAIGCTWTELLGDDGE